MSTSNLLAASASGVVVLGALIGSGRWVIKHYLAELRPNHGSSLSDIVKLQVLPILQKLDATQDDLRQDITDIKVDYARLEGRFDQYVEENK
jgi:hypothetical protein